MLFRNLSSPAKSVYGLISIYLDYKLGSFDYSNKKMSEDSGSSISTIRRGLDDLVSYGVLKETKRPGHTTLYRVIEEVPLMTQEERKEFDEFQELCSNMTPEELDEFAKKNGDEIIIIKFPKS